MKGASGISRPAGWSNFVQTLLSNAIEEGEALAGAQPFIIHLLQFGGPAVGGACLFCEHRRLVEAVHDAVVADRDMGVGVFDDLHRVTAGELQQPDKKKLCAQPRPAGIALLPPACLMYIMFMIWIDHNLSFESGVESFYDEQRKSGNGGTPGGRLCA